MQKASEMTLEQIEEVLNGMDWVEIEKARVFNDYGDKVLLYTDGEFSIMDSSTHYRDPDAAGVIGSLRCWGVGNIVASDYYGDWAERAQDSKWTKEDESCYDVVIHKRTGEEVDPGDWIEDFTGRVIGDTDTMLEEAIEEGDIGFDEYIDEVMRDLREERKYQEELRQEREAFDDLLF